MNIRLAFVDSAPGAAAPMRSYLHAQQGFGVVAEFTSADTLVDGLRTLQPDAIFINMDSSLVADFDVHRLLDFETKPMVVMLANEETHAARAFEIGAIDYLVKPVHPTRFEGTLRRIREHAAIRRVANQPNPEVPPATAMSFDEPRCLAARIMVTERKRTRCIDVNEIEWVKAAGDYSELHVQNGCHILREPISVLVERLPPQVFCRVHRSAVVNLEKVTGYIKLRNSDLLVRLKSKTVLRASRTFSKEFRLGLRRLERSTR